MFVFTTCENNDALNTDSLNNEATSLKAFGPNPALRGQKLSFAGTHLDRITKVILPDNIEITDIEVVNDKLIKVLLPQETATGIIRLIGPGNLELTAKSELTISEPIEITKMTPQPVKAGQVLTIEGNYFNLITKLTFTDKVEILGKDFRTWERTKIEIVVPAEAQSGVIILADDAEIPLEYQSPEALQVVLPSVNSVLNLTNSKPGEEITAAGKDLDLVVKVEMPNGNEAPFTIENSALKFTLPENVSDGVIVMIPASGVRVAVANIGVAMPSGIVVAPDKGLRAGDEITIKGVNMELVTTVKFPGVDEAVTPASKSATEVKVIMPDKAVSGEITLNTAGGKSVAAAIETLKPDVVAYNPSPAPAGSDVKLQGHHLDLVTTVTFGGDLVVPVTPGATDELTVTIPLNAVSGAVVLTMANGETVECQILEIIAPEFAYLPNPPGPKAEIHAGGVLTLDVENGNKLTDVQINGQSVKYILDAPKLYIVVPGNAKGDTELKLVSSNGNAVYTIPVIGAGIVETVIYEELKELTWGDPIRLNKESFASVPAGSKMKVTLSTIASGASIAFNDAGWAKLAVDHPDFDPQWGTVSLPEGATSVEFVLTSDILNTILTVSDGWSETAMLLTGAGAIVAKVSVITGSAPAETAIFEGSHELTWSDPLRLNKELFEGVRGGTIMKFYYTATSDDPQVAVQDASWTKIIIDDPNFDPQWSVLKFPIDGTSYEITLSSDVLNQVMTVDDGWSTTAFLLAGGGVTITKITLW
jgi:hypothetical protein